MILNVKKIAFRNFLGFGNIQIYDAKSRESQAIQAGMEDGENDTKSLLKNKWNSYRDKEKGENTDY